MFNFEGCIKSTLLNLKIENMKDEINAFFNAAKDKGLCDEYISRFLAVKSKKQLMDMALGIQGILYLAQASNAGWGIPFKYMHEHFGMFINGKYIYDSKTYTSEMYLYHNDTIIPNATICTIIDCTADVNIKPYKYSDIYLFGNSKINLIMDEGAKCFVRSYGDNAIIEGDIKGVIIKKCNIKDE